jgi:hypothetical protein
MNKKMRPKRIFMGFRAELILGGKSCAGTIVSFAEKGLGVYVDRASTKTATIDFTPATKIELKFQPSSGETLNLHCEIKWSHVHNNPYGITTSIGMEIIEPSPKYTEFFKTLE